MIGGGQPGCAGRECPGLPMEVGRRSDVGMYGASLLGLWSGSRGFIGVISY